MRMDVLSIQFDADQIASKTRAIHDAMAPCPRKGGIDDAQLAALFRLYDDAFFDGYLHKRVGHALRFRVSSRMTRAGGKTTHFRGRRRFGQTRHEYEIAVAGRLLDMSFGEVGRPVMVTGRRCDDRLEALQRIMEHEIIHLAEFVCWKKSSCNQPRFKTMAMNLFGHTAVRHELVLPHEMAATKHNIRIGDLADFTSGGAELVGRVNRINRRATVLVESGRGERYRDGKTYEKYYVPLGMLRAGGVAE